MFKKCPKAKALLWLGIKIGLFGFTWKAPLWHYQTSRMVHEVKVVLWKSLIMGIQWLWKDKAALELGLEPRTTGLHPIALSHQATRTWEKFATSSIADTDLTSSLGIVKGRPAYKEWLLNVVPPYIADQNMIGTIKSASWYWQSWQNQDIVLYSLQDTHPSTVGQKKLYHQVHSISQYPQELSV